MTLMLASVTGPEEAEIAISGGADIIDLKNPAAGALGALPIKRIRETVVAIDGRRATSAVAGIAGKDKNVMDLAGEIAALGVDFVKVGLSAGGNRSTTMKTIATSAREEGAQAKLIAVLFADQERGYEEPFPAIANAGFAGVMLDTAEKSTRGLLACTPVERLVWFVRAARDKKLMVGLAGGLKAVDVPELLPLRPDFMGFRGALCAGDRQAAIDSARVRAVRDLIPCADSWLAGPRAGDMRRARVA
jgi:dihydroneopterin aldolase